MNTDDVEAAKPILGLMNERKNEHHFTNPLYKIQDIIFQ